MAVFIFMYMSKFCHADSREEIQDMVMDLDKGMDRGRDTNTNIHLNT
jgi:hypothetical protein